MQNVASPALIAPRKPFGISTAVAVAALADLPKPGDYDQALERVIMSLPKGAAFYTPDDIGPLLGITPNAVTRHCRQYPRLRTWKGRYKFFADDPGHVELLRGLVRVILRSGLKLPGALRVH